MFNLEYSEITLLTTLIDNTEILTEDTQAIILEGLSKNDGLPYYPNLVAAYLVVCEATSELSILEEPEEIQKALSRLETKLFNEIHTRFKYSI